MGLKIGLFIFLWLFSASVMAWEEPADFRGQKWGSSAKELPTFYAGGGMQLFEFKAKGRTAEVYWVQSVPFGDRFVDLHLTYINDKLGIVEVSFRSHSFDYIETAFKQKYGKPHSIRNPTVTTAMGAKYLNRELQWHGPTISIWLERYASDITDGKATIGKKVAFKELEEIKQHAAREAAKDL